MTPTINKLTVLGREKEADICEEGGEKKSGGIFAGLACLPPDAQQ